ncbi:MAG: hypothetical protein MJY94_04700 [Bacteroidales bacterium]|nr:hypothetical protein [Bacteroidales bacterium]
MNNGKYALTYLLLLLAQICISNYCNFSWYLYLSILPVMAFLVPIRFNAVVAMLIAFASGFAVDLLSDGVIGLNTLAIVPVAMMRRGIVSLVYGGEFFARQENLSMSRHGVFKMVFSIILSQAVFLAIYFIVDSAGTRPMWFDLTRFGISFVAGCLVSLVVANILEPEKIGL